jgi:hypothetical protein
MRARHSKFGKMLFVLICYVYAKISSAFRTLRMSIKPPAVSAFVFPLPAIRTSEVNLLVLKCYRTLAAALGTLNGNAAAINRKG